MALGRAVHCPQLAPLTCEAQAHLGSHCAPGNSEVGPRAWGRVAGGRNRLSLCQFQEPRHQKDFMQPVWEHACRERSCGSKSRWPTLGLGSCSRGQARTRAHMRPCAHTHTHTQPKCVLQDEGTNLSGFDSSHLFLTSQITLGQRLKLLGASVSSSVNRGAMKSVCLPVLLRSLNALSAVAPSRLSR